MSQAILTWEVDGWAFVKMVAARSALFIARLIEQRHGTVVGIEYGPQSKHYRDVRAMRARHCGPLNEGDDYVEIERKIERRLQGAIGPVESLRLDYNQFLSREGLANHAKEGGPPLRRDGDTPE